MIPPKSKAIFLVNDFRYYYKDGVFSEISIEIAKGFALISVDEIIKVLDQVSIEESGTTKIDYGQSYWKEVKNEIQKQ